jgi:hypothetical protein
MKRQTLFKPYTKKRECVAAREEMWMSNINDSTQRLTTGNLYVNGTTFFWQKYNNL